MLSHILFIATPVLLASLTIHFALASHGRLARWLASQFSLFVYSPPHCMRHRRCFDGSTPFSERAKKYNKNNSGRFYLPPFLRLYADFYCVCPEEFSEEGDYSIKKSGFNVNFNGFCQVFALGVLLNIAVFVNYFYGKFLIL